MAMAVASRGVEIAQPLHLGKRGAVAHLDAIGRPVAFGARRHDQERVIGVRFSRCGEGLENRVGHGHQSLPQCAAFFCLTLTHAEPRRERPTFMPRL